MFDLSKDPRADDPWWSYFVVGARNAEDWLDELRRPFRAGTAVTRECAIAVVL